MTFKWHGRPAHAFSANGCTYETPIIPSGRVERLILNLQKLATPLTDIPDIYQHPIDPDDSHYINLALAAGAELVVSRDRHLLNLTNSQRLESREFIARFPHLTIVDPSQFLISLNRK